MLPGLETYSYLPEHKVRQKEAITRRDEKRLRELLLKSPVVRGVVVSTLETLARVPRLYTYVTSALSRVKSEMHNVSVVGICVSHPARKLTACSHIATARVVQRGIGVNLHTAPGKSLRELPP